MDQEPTAPAVSEEELSFWTRHRFMLLVGGTIVVSLTLVIISMVIYNVSGSAQLDLSRPGYKSVSDQVERDNPMNAYSASGPVNDETVKEFIELYEKEAAKAKGVDAFNGDPLNPEVLEFGEHSASAQ